MTFGGTGTTGVLLQWNSMVIIIHNSSPSYPLQRKGQMKKWQKLKKYEKRAHNDLFLFSHH